MAAAERGDRSLPSAPVELMVEDLTSDGVGVGRWEGQVVLVDQAIPGDRVAVRLTHQARRHAVGSLVQVLEASPERRRPPCILADHCGGCSLQRLEESAQLRWKQRTVEEALQRIGHCSHPVNPILSAPQGLAYRNRGVIPLERDAQGKFRAGFYRRGTHQIVNMNRCPVLDPRLDAMVAPLKADLDSSGWPVDRHGAMGKKRAALRHLALRIGRRSGERLLTLITTHADLPGVEGFARRWMERWPELVGVTLNIQPEPGNRLFGDENFTVRGRDMLVESFAGVDLQIGPDTFFQVYSEQAERVVALLHRALGDPCGQIVEGYCGIGTFTLPLALRGWSVIGIEDHANTVKMAQANASRNGLEGRCCFQQGDVTLLIDRVLEEQEPKALLVDPPRKGLRQEFLEILLRRLPPQILYLSCDPATLARDLSRLTAAGTYGVASIQPLDFFPNTSHVEVLVVLHRSERSAR